MAAPQSLVALHDTNISEEDYQVSETVANMGYVERRKFHHIEMLMKSGRPGTTNDRVMELLIDYRDENVNERCVAGYTPLMMAAGTDNFKIAKLLLKNGADTDLMSDSGETALSRAILGGHSLRIVELILNHQSFTWDNYIPLAQKVLRYAINCATVLECTRCGEDECRIKTASWMIRMSAKEGHERFGELKLLVHFPFGPKTAERELKKAEVEFMQQRRRPYIPYEFLRTYELENNLNQRSLGNGANGTVFKVQDCDREKRYHPICAVKVAFSRNTSSRELSMLEHVKRAGGHRNINGLIESFSDLYNSGAFIVLQYAKFGSLRHYTRKNINLGDNFHKSVFRQIIEGLRFLHSVKIMHDDLKSENILVSGAKGNEVVQISDLGNSSFMDQNGYVYRSLGTPIIQAPEFQVSSQKVYGRSADIFSAGCLLYELITTTSPLEPATFMRLCKLSYAPQWEKCVRVGIQLAHWEEIKTICYDSVPSPWNAYYKYLLCISMLRWNPADRSDIDHILANPWLSS